MVTVNYSSSNSKTYPGNSQWLIEVLSPNQPESPGSRTLHHDPERHDAAVSFSFLLMFRDVSQTPAHFLLPKNMCSDQQSEVGAWLRHGSTGAGGWALRLTLDELDFEASTLIRGARRSCIE